MEQTVIKVGNSIGVIIPQSLKAGFKPGDKIIVEKGANGAIIATKKGSKKAVASIDPQFLQIVERVNKRYAAAFKELANR